MSLILAYKTRGVTKDVVVTDGSGVAVSLGVNDKIRCIIGREGKLFSDLSGAQLVITSDAATANGSSFTKGGGNGGSHRLRIDADDLSFAAGTYSAIFDYFDNADASEWKNFSREVFVLEDT